MKTVKAQTRLDRLLVWCESQDASDLHAKVGSAMSVRINGRLIKLSSSEFPVLDQDEISEWIREAFDGDTFAEVQAEQEVDFSFQRGKVRYRAHFSKQQGSQSFSFRLVPSRVLTLKDLRLPESLYELTRSMRGLVLVTGATGQGKSTTARALIEELNRTKALRIITIEDPIEYVFSENLSSIEQREVGIDTASFAVGIRNSMRQDPDVIFIGEVRDRESVHAGLQAAETGHLVFATLHADSTAQAVSRIREFYPEGDQSNITSLLSRNLNAVITQRLLSGVSGARIPCLEIMKRNSGVADAIQSNDLKLLTGMIENAVNEGMHSFDQYLLELLAEGVIDESTALANAVHPHPLDLKLRGIRTSGSILKPDRMR